MIVANGGSEAARRGAFIVFEGVDRCGKTTQLPQLVLDDMILRGQGALVNIICTQPRRISAIGVADRYALEVYAEPAAAHS